MALRHLTPTEMDSAPRISPPLGAAAFEVKGRLYAGNGRQCNMAGEIIPDPELDAIDADVPLQAGESEIPNLTTESSNDNSGETAVTDPIDLNAWAYDKAKYQWFAVQAAIKEQHGQSFTKASDAKEFIKSLATAG